MNIIKRSGEEMPFMGSKILAAVKKANKSVSKENELKDWQIDVVVNRVSEEVAALNRAVKVDEIQNLVEKAIMALGAYEVAKNYVIYRYRRDLSRKGNSTDEQILSLVECNNEEVKQENSNKNPTVVSVQRDYIAGETSKDICRRLILPKDVVKAHDEGIIHFHDMDYFIGHMSNCCLVNLEDMLQNGTVISGTMIEKPHSFSTACNVATQIIAQVASCQYGGQSISLSHLAPFVEVSRQKIRKDLDDNFKKLGIEVPQDKFDELVESQVRDEIKKGVQTIQYQVVTLMTTNGQAPFITVFMYLNEVTDEQTKKDLALVIEEVLRQRIQGVKNEVGVYVTPAFPKLIYVLQEDNIREGTPYWYLTELAAKCTAKRLVPDYISEKKMLEYKINANGDGSCYTCMGCRSFLTPDNTLDAYGNIEKSKNYTPDKPKFYGRFNQGVVTVNLVDAALSAESDLDRFWAILDERCELCHKALQCRHKRLEGTLSDAAPILWQHGALARLEKGEKIDPLLLGGYSTLSLGYAGLWECVYALIGKKLTEKEGEELGLQVMQRLNDFTAKWKADENIAYSLYGTPLESTTYKFAKSLQRRFGVIPHVTDKSYVTNSYHVHVTEKVNAFEKLALESKFQRLSPGGAISYVEVPNMQNNIKAVEAIMQFIYENIVYAELNTKSDYCLECGFDGEIKIVEDDNGKLVWECPKCGNRDQTKMSVVRRSCGYCGSQFWNQGRTAEIRDRVLHVS